MGDSDDGKEQQRRDSGRDRDRSRRGERPSRFSEASVRDRSGDRGGGGHDRTTTSSSSRKSSNCRVYVSNICYEYRWQDLKDLFRDHVGDVSFVELFVDESDKPKGCGIVEFSDSASVKKCMEVMHRFDLKGRKLVIKEDFGNERDKHGNIVNGGGGRRNRDRHNMDKDWDDRDSRRSGGNSGGGNTGGNWDNSPPSLLSTMMARSAGPTEPPEFKWGNTYGLSPQFLESLNIHKPLVNRVFVANLDYKVDAKKLREVFKLCGKVSDIELYHDKDGNSRGFAVVEYDHPVESVQAISMLHNQMLYDRQMTVRMDRVDHDVPLKLPDGLKGVGMGLGVNGEPLRDVSRNLPNTSGGMAGGGGGNMGGGGGMGPNSGPGILGAVPNPSAGLSSLGNALQNVVNAPAALANLTGQSAAALQASLSGVSAPFLAGNNMGNDLNLANLTNSNLNSSLGSLNSSLTQNHALAALGGGMGGSSGGLGNNMGSSGGGGGVMSGRFVSMGNRDYSRGDSSNNDYMSGGNGNMGGGNGNMGGGNGSMGGGNGSMAGGGGSLGGSGNLLSNMSSTAGGGMNRDYTTVNRSQDYEQQQNSSMRNYEMMAAQDNQDNYRQSNIYSTVNNGSQNRTGNSAKTNTGYSDTIIVSNLPISATWKMLKEKFSNAGEVMFVEMKSKDTAIIRYGSEWQAERAIKLMDRVRIDGRTLDVRFFY